MEKNESMPLISVIIPVYNSEDVIRRSLDSLLNQTYQNLEIIVVDDGSTDKTPDILRDYQAQQKVKMQVLRIENSGQGKARTVGIQAAEGDLIAFCDADDYYDADGMEIMERSLHKQNADVLYLPCIRQKALFSFRVGEIFPPYDPDRLIRKAVMFGFYNVLVKKELLLELGEIPSIIYEDVAYVGALLTRAQNLAYYPHPVYHYVDTPGSVVNSKTNPRILELREAIDWGISHADEKYKQELIMALAQKCMEKVKSVWYYGDCFFEKLMGMRGLIENNPCYLENPKDYKVLRYYLELPGTAFPRIVYVDGISRNITESELELIQKEAFREGADVFLMTEDMCDASRKIPDKKMKAAYCGMSKILETGGIYIGSEIRIKAPFDCMRYYRSFLGYEHRTLLSARVFGGQKADAVLKKIFDVWTEKLKGESCSLDEGAQLMTDLLVSEYGLKLKGEVTYTQYPFCTLGVTVVTVDYTDNSYHMCQLEREAYSEDMQMLSLDQVKGLVELPTVEQAKKINNQNAKISRLEFRARQMNKELEPFREMQHSGLYDLMLKLRQRKWGRTLLKLLKHVVK